MNTQESNAIEMAFNALMVIVSDQRHQKWMVENDPQALMQAHAAVMELEPLMQEIRRAREHTEQVRAELRKALGVSQALIDTYDTDEAVYRSGKHWVCKCIDGSTFPLVYKTRAEARETARKHKAMKQDQCNRPEEFTSLSAERARQVIELAEYLMEQVADLTEMEAYQIARERVEARAGTHGSK